MPKTMRQLPVNYKTQNNHLLLILLILFSLTTTRSSAADYYHLWPSPRPTTIIYGHLRGRPPPPLATSVADQHYLWPPSLPTTTISDHHHSVSTVRVYYFEFKIASVMANGLRSAIGFFEK
ncbi:hypothetical protein Droror1_Dr00010696 [Drosera rotundifolia]